MPLDAVSTRNVTPSSPRTRGRRAGRNRSSTGEGGSGGALTGVRRSPTTATAVSSATSPNVARQDSSAASRVPSGAPSTVPTDEPTRIVPSARPRRFPGTAAIAVAAAVGTKTQQARAASARVASSTGSVGASADSAVSSPYSTRDPSSTGRG